MQQVPTSFRPGMNNAFYFIRHPPYKELKKDAPGLKWPLAAFWLGSNLCQSLFTNVTEYIDPDDKGEGLSPVNENAAVFYTGKIIFTHETFANILSNGP